MKKNSELLFALHQLISVVICCIYTGISLNLKSTTKEVSLPTIPPNGISELIAIPLVSFSVALTGSYFFMKIEYL